MSEKEGHHADYASKVFLLVLLAAIVVRVAVVGIGITELKEDADSYARLAVNLAEQGVFGFEVRSPQVESSAADMLPAVRPTAYRPPGYPWILSWLVADGSLQIWAVAALHVLLGVASVVLCFLLAKQIGVVAWIAALALAMDPILLRQSQLVMTETLAAFLALLIWYLWVKLLKACQTRAKSVASARLANAMYLGLGVLFGVAILTRPPMAIWAVLCGLCLPWKPDDGKSAESNELPDGTPPFSFARLGIVISFALGIAFCLVPWIVRNQLLLGKPIWATTHGGYTLLLANNPLLYEHFRRNGPSRGWDAEPFHSAWATRDRHRRSPTDLKFWTDDPLLTRPIARSELQDDRLAYEAAKATIVQNPGTFLLASFYRVGWLWAIGPYQQSWSLASLLVSLWYCFWFGLACYQLCLLAWQLIRQKQSVLLQRLMSWPLLPGLLLVVSLTGVHAVYWSNMRMRAPMMCVVYLLAVPRTKDSAESQ